MRQVEGDGDRHSVIGCTLQPWKMMGHMKVQTGIQRDNVLWDLENHLPVPYGPTFLLT